MKTSDVVPYKIAKQLKELGFDEPTYKVYSDMRYEKLYKDKNDMLQNWITISGGTSFHNSYNPDVAAAPLWQDVFEWFITKHHLNGYPLFNFNGKWSYQIQKVQAGLLTGQITEYIDFKDDFYQAREAVVEKLIIRIKMIKK